MLEGKEITIILISYALGCFNTGYYLVRFRKGEDIRTLGSGTAGAKNTGRILGATGFVIAFLGDLFKGILAVWLAFAFNLSAPGTVAALSAVVAGHIWPVQLRFRGGKGIAAALGGLVIFDITLTLVLFGLLGLAAALTRRFTASGLLIIFTAPLVAVAIGRPQSSVIGVTIVVFFILIAHRKNISNLVKKWHS